MIDKETYEKEIIRMWDSLRDDYIGYNTCRGVMCKMCPLHDILVDDIRCGNAIYTVKMINIVEKWSKEHPQKHKISQLEYDMLQEAYSIYGNFRMYQDELINNLREKGYFKGSNEGTDIEHYLKNCEVA